MIGWILLGVFIFALFLNVPVAYALLVSSTVVVLYFDIIPMGFLTQSLFTAGDSFPLLAVPFFILAGDIMMEGGISRRLIDFATTLLGHRTGGLGFITCFTCMIFAAISGSGPATTAAIGGIMIPAMIKDNYDGRFASSLAASAGAMGPVIPPSIAFVVYGVTVGTSITGLFAAGIVPGIMMGLSLMIYTWYISKKKNFGIKRPKASMKEILSASKSAIWSLLIPVIILGGIYGGIFTPTEAAVVACDYGIIIGVFVYKEIKFKDLIRIIGKTALTSGTVLVLVGCATVFGRILTIQGIPTSIANTILSLTNNKVVILLLINLLLFITGMLMETLAAIVILAPLLIQIVTPLGVDPIHFGMIMCINLVIGMCTPPVGVNMFVAARIGQMKVERMFKYLFPMIGVLMVVQLLLTFIPAISTFLPSIIMK